MQRRLYTTMRQTPTIIVLMTNQERYRTPLAGGLG